MDPRGANGCNAAERKRRRKGSMAKAQCRKVVPESCCDIIGTSTFDRWKSRVKSEPRPQAWLGGCEVQLAENQRRLASSRQDGRSGNGARHAWQGL